MRIIKTKFRSLVTSKTDFNKLISSKSYLKKEVKDIIDNTYTKPTTIT